MRAGGKITATASPAIDDTERTHEPTVQRDGTVVAEDVDGVLGHVIGPICTSSPTMARGAAADNSPLTYAGRR